MMYSYQTAFAAPCAVGDKHMKYMRDCYIVTITLWKTKWEECDLSALFLSFKCITSYEIAY